MNETVKKILTTRVLDMPGFDPEITGQTTEDEKDYGVLKDTPLANTIVEKLYLGIKNKDNGFTFEENGTEFTFLSPTEIMERNVFNGKMFDIFITYLGMGHAIVFYYIPKTGLFSFRQDGGSNDYDRADNYEHYNSESFDPSSFPTVDGDLETHEPDNEFQYTIEQLLTLLRRFNEC